MTSAPTCCATSGRPLCSQASLAGRCAIADGPAHRGPQAQRSRQLAPEATRPVRLPSPRPFWGATGPSEANFTQGFPVRSERTPLASAPCPRRNARPLEETRAQAAGPRGTTERHYGDADGDGLADVFPAAPVLACAAAFALSSAVFILAMSRP